ncbi:GDSL esterase/lipase EXL3, partial [Mucuna pruriens]
MDHCERLVTVLVLFFFGILVAKPKAVNGAIPALFSFGDSILDTGNNNNLPTLSKCNFPPYGRDFVGGIPTGRFCDGKNPSDLIAASLGIKETVPAFLDPNLKNEDLPSGVTFASGGSGIDDATAGITRVLSLEAQLGNFQSYIEKLNEVVGKERASDIISNSVILVSAGNNDIAITYYSTLATLQPFPTYANTLVAGASNFLKRLYALGARHVWVFSTLPLGCLPGGRTLAGGPFRICAPIVNQQAQLFNSQLSSSLNSLRSTLSNYDIRFIHVCTPLFNLVQNPRQQGFVDASDGCCGTTVFGASGLCNLVSVCPNPSSYVFWDFAHPTEKAYQFIVSSILRNNNISTSFAFSPFNSSLSH